MDRIGLRASAGRACIFSLGELLATTAFGAADTISRVPQFGTFGIDLTAQDKAVRPGDDFYRYVDGQWLATEKIPADRATWGSFAVLREQADSDVKSIIEEAAGAQAPAGTNEQKIGDFYNAFLD